MALRFTRYLFLFYVVPSLNASRQVPTPLPATAVHLPLPQSYPMAPAQHGSRRLWSRTRNLSVPESSGVRYLADWLEHVKEPHHEDYDFEVPRKSRLHRTGVPAQIYMRSPSLRSTTATASDSHGDFSSNTDDYSSGSSGVHLTVGC